MTFDLKLFFVSFILTTVSYVLFRMLEIFILINLKNGGTE